MLLVFDVGNTNMVIGIYKDKSLVKDWRICTDIHKTSDEYGMLIGNLLAHNNIDIKSIDDVIISSVVPNVMHALENFCIKYCEKKPMIVGPGIKTGLNIKYDNPLREYLNWRVILAYVMFFGILLLNTWCYTKVDMRYGPVIDTAAYVFVLLLSRFILNEKITKGKLIGNLIIIAGILVYTL